MITSYGWYDTVLYPLKWIVAWVMVIIHKFLTLIGIPNGPGIGWILSIVLLTVAVRLAIFPLFTKQIRSQRAMQALAPEIKKLQARYKGKNDTASKQAQQQELMALYKEHGTSPFASCLPILVQIPIFTALFRVLAATAGIETGDYTKASGRTSIGPLDKAMAIDINSTKLFGANMIETFSTAATNQSKIVIGVLILIMVLTQFFTMRQISVKNMPASALEGPQANVQKTMMYIMPLFIGMTGFFFQVGLLLYMLTTNFFTLGQQLWAISAMPTPGSEAYKKWHAKQQAKYDTFFTQVTAEYDQKLANVGADQQVTDLEAAREELIIERDEKLRLERVRLGLEEKNKKVEVQTQTGPRVQPTRKPRAARKNSGNPAKNQRSQQNAQDDYDAELDANGQDSEEGLSAEEIARRRAERRAAERARKAAQREAKMKAREERLRKQGRRPGDMELG
ncbi:hypothetical protein BSR29_00130 [Boudabousia liubingyangii]|uniref:Membrane protein insertase YidC n=2 Tax=Boudabousia liubingyangii TaxID=1921764 RepID=A0A1Q5PP93_9ACTO|nr:hypothetical protein BSR28_02350 [Boudabousia liubingyangii]OKL49418.1 hypothetical protein BSR29_00130 [Boudabousia liubingyangii]